MENERLLTFMAMENNLTVKDSTHLLECKHCIGNRCAKYNMSCILISVTKSGKSKVLVFGDRNWKDKDHIKNIRYVDPFRLTKIG